MKDFDEILPFATWMGLMYLLPETAWAYAARSSATLAALVFYAGRHADVGRRPPLPALLVAFALGLALFAVWIIPEELAPGLYRRLFVLGTTANASVADASAGWKLARLAGSVLVISAAEELFFRRWVMSRFGILISSVLFAAGHNRYLVAFVAGLVYARLTRRFGLFAAILAHATTNLALGAWVWSTGSWQYW